MKAPTFNRVRPGHLRLRLLAAITPGSRVLSSALLVLAVVSASVVGLAAGVVPGSSTAFASSKAGPVVAWTASAAQLPAGSGTDPNASLAALACPADGSCVATGRYSDTSGNQQGLIETLDSGSWTATEAPLPLGAGSDPLVSLGAVACPVDGSCVATGNYTDSAGNQQGLIETLDSGSWTATEAPLPLGAGGDPQATLTAPACPVTGSCVVTGDYKDGDGVVGGTIDTLSGGNWTAQPVQLPAGGEPGSGSSITAADCPADGSCVAMADYTDSLGNVQTAIETLSGGNWTPTEAPVPSGLGSGFHQRNVLTSVTCTAAGSCVAVGSYSPAQGDRAPLIETLAGGNWTPVEPGLPSNAAPSNGFGQLDVVTCPTISACVALGWYDDALGDNHGVMEMESGSTWSPVEQVLPTSPAPRSSSNPDEGIGSAVCPAAGSCVAVGSYFDKRAKDKSIIETLAGGTWSTIKAPLPTKADGNQPSELPALSCTADGSCVAVGSVGGQALTETLPGGQTAPSVTNSDEATFTVDAFGSFTLTATGNPVPAITKRGKLPKGLHFTSGRGTATISGTPLGAPGNYSVIIDADNGVLPTASQDLTLTITS